MIELCKFNIIFFLIDKPENVQLTTNASANKACQNGILELTCSVGDANPEVTSYQLFRNGTDVGESNSGMWVKTLSNSGLSMYKCVANNSVGSSESPSVSITINGNHGSRFFISTSFNPASRVFLLFYSLWPFGQRVGLAMRTFQVRVPLWRLWICPWSSLVQILGNACK